MRVLLFVIVAGCAGCASIAVPQADMVRGTRPVSDDIAGNAALGPFSANQTALLSSLMFRSAQRNQERARGGYAAAMQPGRPSPSGRI